MIRKLLSVLLVLLLAASPLCAHAQQDYARYVNEIYGAAIGEGEMQTWLDGYVSEGAGSNIDCYVISLCHATNRPDFTAYVAAAKAAVQGENIKNVVSRMRCMLALLFCGEEDAITAEMLDVAIGKLGVMSYVYGLHLLNNGAESELWTRESLVEKLLSLQKPDGGWAVTGNFGDVDVTCMCLQALAGCENDAAVSESIAKALDMLALRQMENGGFSSYGRENSESAAQVIMALASLEIDPANNDRFTKNGVSPVDVLLSYHLGNGVFAHLPGEAGNELASLQALQAFTALCAIGQPYYLKSDAAFYELDQLNAPESSSWKIWALAVIALFALIGIVRALISKHGRLKRLIFVLLLAGIAAAGVFMLQIESSADYYRATDKPAADGEVYISVRCDVVAGHANDGSTPEDGAILARTPLPYAEGDSVFDILTEAVRRFKIHMEHEGGSGDMAYVTGINHLYEYAYGDLSGWVYSVNGERYSIGSGAFEVHAGDEISWDYTLNIGEDL